MAMCDSYCSNGYYAVSAKARTRNAARFSVCNAMPQIGSDMRASLVNSTSQRLRA